MKGLLVKDIRFLLGQKSSMIIFVALGLFFLVTGEDVSFAIMYTMMLAAIFSTTSITYDAFENGMAFLLTLPVQKKVYVVSKYIFAALVVTCMGVLLCGLAYGCNAVGVSALDLSSLGDTFVMAITAAVVMVSVMIPVYIILGPEKARVGIVVLAGVVCAAGFILSKVAGDGMIKVTALLGKLEGLSNMQATLLGIGFLVVVLLVSMAISMAGLEKKEY